MKHSGAEVASASHAALPPAAPVHGHWLSRAAAAHILFPIIAIFALVVVWGFTLNIIRSERAAAERSAEVFSHQLADTYEAQVVRALREIDETLKVVKYAYDIQGGREVLQKLKARNLLPPELLFRIRIVDSKGHVLASNRPSTITDVANLRVFQEQRQAGSFVIGPPRRSQASGVWELDFSRRLDAPKGGFAGIVMLSVDASYFASGYEASQLGEHGVLGLLGTDGIFRVRRSGNVVTAGEHVDPGTLVLHAEDEKEIESTLSTNAWDGIQRYTSARRIYAFPLIVIAGLSADEQLAMFRKNMYAYLWRAGAGSVLLLLVIAVMGRMARQLELSRLRVIDEQAAYAARVEYLAYHDGLTGLPNRSLFSKLLDQGIKKAQRYDRKLAVMFFDLDHFKEINDTLGHEAGDMLLREVAARLKACLRASDTIARMGGDEFVALLPEFNEEQQVATVARKILATIARPIMLHKREYCVTASVGISLYPRDGEDEQALEKKADIAMYWVKEQGRNGFRFYSAGP